MIITAPLIFLASTSLSASPSSKVVIAGGTGILGRHIASLLASKNEVVILSRNAFVAGTPQRVSNQHGYLGQRWLLANPNCRLRDWDGGDPAFGITSNRWIGWQDELEGAAAVIDCVGQKEGWTYSVKSVARIAEAVNGYCNRVPEV